MFFWFLFEVPRRGIEEGGPIVEFPHVIGGTFRCFGGLPYNCDWGDLRYVKRGLLVLKNNL
jgi:hypothetical protein